MELVDSRDVSRFVATFKKLYRLLCKKSPAEVIRGGDLGEDGTRILGLLPKVPYAFDCKNPGHVFSATALFASQLSPLVPMRGNLQVVCILDNPEGPVRINIWADHGKPILVARGAVLFSNIASDIGKTKDYLLRLSSFFDRRRNPYSKYENLRLSGCFCFSTDSVHMILPKGNWFYTRNKLLQTDQFAGVSFLHLEDFVRHFVRKEG